MARWRRSTKGLMPLLTKQDITRSLQSYNSGAGVICKAQIGRFLGEQKPGRRTDKITAGLTAIDGKWYLVTDVAGAILRRME